MAYPPKNLIPELVGVLQIDPLVAQYVSKCPPAVQQQLADKPLQNVWRWKSSTGTWAMQQVPLAQLWREALKQVFDGGRVRNDAERRQYVETIRAEAAEPGKKMTSRMLFGSLFTDAQACDYLHVKTTDKLLSLAQRASVVKEPERHVWRLRELKKMRALRERDADWED